MFRDRELRRSGSGSESDSDAPATHAGKRSRTEALRRRAAHPGVPKRKAIEHAAERHRHGLGARGRIRYAGLLALLDDYHAQAGSGSGKKTVKQLGAIASTLVKAAKLAGELAAAAPHGSDLATTLARLKAALDKEHARVVQQMAKSRQLAAKRRAIQKRIVKAPAADQHGKKFDWVGKDGPLQGKAKGAKYEDEDKKFGWRKDTWTTQRGRDDPRIATAYETSAEDRRKSAVTVSDDGGKLKQHDGTPLETGNGQLGWAMDPKTGRMHTFKLGRLDRVDPATGKTVERDTAMRTQEILRKGDYARIAHHTTPLAGADVAGAGAIQAEGGAITRITDESGHYTPEAEYTHQAVKHLSDSGAKMQSGGEDLRSAQVSLTGYNNLTGAGKRWIQDENDAVEQSNLPAQDKEARRMYEGNLALPYQAFLTSHGNERQMRLKQTLTNQISDKVPKTKPAAESNEDAGYSGYYANEDAGKPAAESNEGAVYYSNEDAGYYLDSEAALEDSDAEEVPPGYDPE